MSRLRQDPESHLVGRIGWLRAAVLGANDGIISTASLIVGVAAAAATRNDVLIAGVGGLVAGAMSMAAGEYVSVSSQSDTEQADLARERMELRESPEFLVRVVVSPVNALALSGASLAFLALFGAIGAKGGGASILRATIRVTFWGALALLFSARIGRLFGTVGNWAALFQPISLAALKMRCCAPGLRFPTPPYAHAAEDGF